MLRIDNYCISVFLVWPASRWGGVSALFVMSVLSFNLWACTIEDDSLAVLDNKVVSKVLSSKTFHPFKELGCQLVGKQIVGFEQKQVFFITTSDACGWGANLGPIWLVVGGRERYDLALYSGGYGVDVSGSTGSVSVWSELGGLRSYKSYVLVRDKYVEN
ncbi:hypothetical protein [Pseudomonas sp. PDM22]|uniref:hypothetical protein n=1 Tax=Pseudomonas sp. PDM22 TaxID=2769287 RepID=UPI00111C8D6B|nr:hypothetical protein [Pseudomonas sp. PDM22]MBD9516104.1 hypothetical protein [Pseudomonas sp. PDM22]